MPPFSRAGNLLFSGLSLQRSIFDQSFALSSADRTATLRLCSVPPPYGTTGSEVPLIINIGTGREGKQIIVFGMSAPTAAAAATRSLRPQPALKLISPPSDSPTT